ncbi:GlsB/YeaQ/YmgE family stress response membrane protein [Cereibacter changlensis JA139]|uniref:GlsB/YeaQ/YmgE family stress response membrane protein n=2 Tax=Cereibacter changlensis TaxID=402884 RepID=A0A2T4JYA7_9RHOB|nr:GlsB/YeaQ/YmgE family stress response membrane protein [Cereibacter changlensis]PTE22777.1 GlsB/YeaQ/YmgE family stress response membrane protein [Cereibacter changlensis JA139]PZX52377.1 hypothetical protein LX76_02906 [Cereibacter changlensis]
MEEFIQGVGIFGMVLLVLIGLVAGWLASVAAGRRNRGRYLAIGVIGALLAPLLLVALGVTVLAASGLLAVLLAAAVGAVIVLVLAKMIFD